MKGVQFIIDDHGNPTSVILDLSIWSEIWEDIYVLKTTEVIRQEGGPSVSWETLESELDAELAAMNAADSDAADD